MGDQGRRRPSLKDRLRDSWYQPWTLRKTTVQTRNQESLAKDFRHRKRRPLSSTPIASDQSRCTFLSRVPGEIRNAIYLLMIGNRHLCILQSPTSAVKDKITHRELVTLDGSSSLAIHESPTKLAILQTCRQIYAEVADILYAVNCYHVNGVPHLQSFIRFTNIISPTRLSSITSLEISCDVSFFEPGDPLASEYFKQWKKTWATVAQQMPGLRHLTLKLQHLWMNYRLKLTPETYWVKPFLQVRGLQTFELVVEPNDLKATPGNEAWQDATMLKELTARVNSLRHRCHDVMVRKP
ncbi:MAG: hypothetical protein Q9174_000653 [Haloplaca sp. 1 TL-2023]